MAKTIENKDFFDIFSLNEQQKRAVEAPRGPLLVIAGAGTGKTRTLTSRLLYLIANNTKPQSICAVTFTNKAAQEMKDRVLPHLSGSKNPFIGTFHSLGVFVLRKEAHRIGRSSQFIIYDDHDKLVLIKKVLKNNSLVSKINPSIASHAISKIKREISNINKENDKNIQSLFVQYEQHLKTNNAFDFDDLIEKTVYLLKKFPDVLKKYQSTFSHLLVDEYQDINNAQYELIKLLSLSCETVTVVGDDCQAIYSWRGSRPEYFAAFLNEQKNAHIVQLEENYRSTENIIRAASILSRSNIAIRKTLWTKNPAGEPVSIIEHRGVEEEALWIAQAINNTKSKNQTIAVLYRTNAQSRALEQALLENEIPYRIFGGTQFYERREIRDIVAALRCVLNPDESVSRERLDKTFSKTKNKQFQEGILELQSLTPTQVIKKTIELLEYFSYLERTFPNARERRENIEEFVRFTQGFKTLWELLEKVTLLQANDLLNVRQKKQKSKNKPTRLPKPEAIGDGGQVNLMTIHAAKGLEFDTVFIAGSCEGILPHERSFGSSASEEEEQRLMYVAMTRAKKKLLINFYGSPSRFLFELPKDCCRFEAGTDGGSFVLDEECYITID